MVLTDESLVNIIMPCVSYLVARLTNCNRMLYILGLLL